MKPVQQRKCPENHKGAFKHIQNLFFSDETHDNNLYWTNPRNFLRNQKYKRSYDQECTQSAKKNTGWKTFVWLKKKNAAAERKKFLPTEKTPLFGFFWTSLASSIHFLKFNSTSFVPGQKRHNQWQRPETFATFGHFPSNFSVDAGPRILAHKPDQFKVQLNSIQKSILPSRVYSFFNVCSFQFPLPTTPSGLRLAPPDAQEEQNQVFFLKILDRKKKKAGVKGRCADLKHWPPCWCSLLWGMKKKREISEMNTINSKRNTCTVHKHWTNGNMRARTRTLVKTHPTAVEAISFLNTTRRQQKQWKKPTWCFSSPWAWFTLLVCKIPVFSLCLPIRLQCRHCHP